MPWLTELQLSSNNITSLEPLRELTSLEKLDVGGGGSDVSPLENLPKLWKLVLPSNNLGNIAPLNKIKSLKHLSLNGNEIYDVIPLSQITGLEVLYLYNNYITNIESLESLVNLSYVALENNCISDFSPIDYLKQNGKLTTVTGATAEEQDYARCQ